MFGSTVTIFMLGLGASQVGSVFYDICCRVAFVFSSLVFPYSRTA